MSESLADKQSRLRLKIRVTVREQVISPRHWRRNVIAVVFGTAAVLLLIVAGSQVYDFWDSDPDRGATTVAQDSFGDSFTTVKYLDQGWEPKDSLWFYNTTQGSDLLPYDFFMVLEQKDKSVLFRTNDNLNNRYRY